MKNTADYKSRFRILKGGKISLVISALLVGSIASADVESIINPNGTTVNVLSWITSSDITLISHLSLRYKYDIEII